MALIPLHRAVKHFVAVAVVACSQSVLAQDTILGNGPEVYDEPRFVIERDLDSTWRIAEGALGMDELIEVLPALGGRRVVVGLAIPIAADEVQSYGDTGIDQYRDLAAAAKQEFSDLLEQRFSLSLSEEIESIDGMPYLTLPANAEVIAFLRELPIVRSINLETGGTALLNQSSNFVGANTAHSSSITGSGKRIAIIDTGVARSHPVFSGRVSSEACYSSGTYSLIGDICNAGSYGSTTTNSGGPCDDDPDCYPGHGSHVGTILAGNSVSPGGGVPSLKGIAYQSQLISVMALSRVDLNSSICGIQDPCYRFFESNVAAALSHIRGLTPKNIASVNLSISLGTSASHFVSGTCDSSWPLIRDAVNLLVGDGVAVVAGSGNSGGAYPNKMTAPSCLSNVTSVAATSKSSNTFQSWSNAASTLNMLAPGGGNTYNYTTSDCRSTTPYPYNVTGPFVITDGIWAGYYRPSICTSGYIRDSGTSMSSPHVAAAFALMEQKYPDASPTGIADWIEDSGVSVSFSQSGTSYTRPRLSISAAMSPPTAPSAGPSSVTVTNHQSFGSNNVSYPSVSGSTEYHIQGSTSSSFTTQSTYYRGPLTSKIINVPVDSYIRVRACNMVSCGPWTNASNMADYFSGCL